MHTNHFFRFNLLLVLFPLFRSSQESPPASNRRRTSPRSRHSDQEENKTLSRAGKNDGGKDTGRDVIEDSQSEQRTDRFKSERFDSNDNTNDSTSKGWRNSESERRGGGRGYRGRGPSQQEWRDSNKLQESLSDPTHVPRLGQFFEVRYYMWALAIACPIYMGWLQQKGYFFKDLILIFYKSEMSSNTTENRAICHGVVRH